MTLDQALEAARLAAVKSGGERPIWPDEYADATGDAAFKWVTECWWTFNEAEQAIQPIPPLEFVEAFVHEWFDCWSRRQPLIVEKSRRLMFSWIARSLETWAMGLRRGDSIVIDQTHANSAEHLWRVHFSLTELRARRPELRIPPHQVRGGVDSKDVSAVILSNGSLMTQGYQDAGAAQGKGKSIVVLEEVSKYRNPAAFWGQSLIVTQGSAGSPGGWVCAICNASPNPQWRELKDKVKMREVLGFE